MYNLKNLSGGPLRANRCREMPRGIGAFLCMVLGPNSGLTICKTHPDKTLHPTPFFSTERSISGRLGFGMRLPSIPYSSAWHPYSAMSSPLAGTECPAEANGRSRERAGRIIRIIL
jgi:hypothetical protein